MRSANGICVNIGRRSTKLSISGVGRPVVAAHLRKIASDSGPVAADRARATLSAMYGWAIGEGLCETNPVTGTNTASDNEPRDRVLSDAELATIWKAAPNDDYGRIAKLLLLTGQRREEIGGLRWSEIDVGDEPFALPARARRIAVHMMSRCRRIWRWPS